MERKQLAPGVCITTLDASKFNRCRITLHLRFPARRESATDAAVLALVRVFRAIPAAHIAILVLAVSFTVLACVNMKQRIINANLARVEAGVDEEPDWGVLWECGYQEEP